ncbi:hypothetical protein D4765_11405 [Subtercola vilae]|uniref:Uncharacterized protein n=1 Tax=Subtercola vilae TaxID=2056433 RepID=A0A4T2BUI4_9MICO|nr:hypothetical protein [Subtercola sp. RTI3]TIH35137.1 hypothetical protein D4765_11405 [Subtercola vilae]
MGGAAEFAAGGASAVAPGVGAENVVPDGINLWMPVADERAAMVALAASGIRVAAGSSFRAGPSDDGHSELGQQYVRITAGAVRGDVEEVAALLAAASRQA